MKQINKQKDILKAEQVVYLWLSFTDKNDKLEGVAGSSSSTMGAVQDFMGEIPRGGGFKPETVALRAEAQKQIPITTDELLARNALMSLSTRARLVVSAWPQIRRQENPQTGEIFTKKDLIKVLRVYGINFNNVEELGEAIFLASLELLAAAKKFGLMLEG